MNEILADLAHHAERFQEHANTAKSSDASQEDRENAFFNAQVQIAGMQNKFQEALHHASLELNEILRGFGINWIKDVRLEEKKEYVDDDVKAEIAATPETHEPVQPTPQPQFLGDVPQVQVVQETTPTTTEASTTTQEQGPVQQTTP